VIELTDCSLFKGMDERTAGAIAEVFVRARFEAGDVLFHEGAEGKALVVVLEGLLELTQRGTSGEIHLADVEPGRVLGLTSLVDPGPRTASLRALDDGEVAVLDRATFNKLWQAQGDAAAKLHLQLARVAIQELRSADRKLSELLEEPMEPRLSGEAAELWPRLAKDLLSS
jgi:CRP/FNR family cyclic AMP-dependent transcriptional regulator